MAGGFDFMEFLSNPIVQASLGIMSQQRKPGEGPLAPIGRGVLQGMDSYQQRQQMQQQQDQLKQQAVARNGLADVFKQMAPIPRPLAFEPQPGDEEAMRKYNQYQAMGNAVGAGIDPQHIAKAIELMNPQAKKQNLMAVSPGAKVFDPATGQMVFENPSQGPEGSGVSLQVMEATKNRDAAKPGSATYKMWDNLVNKLTTNAPAASVNVHMPPTFDAAGKLRDDYRQDTKRIAEVGSTVDTMKSLLANPPSAANDLAIQRQVSSLFNAGQRAASEVQAWRNFGDLPTRMVGGISRFATGKYTDTQRQELANIVDTMDKQLVKPSESAVNEFYGGIADSYKIPRTQVYGPKVGARQQGNALTSEEQTRLEFLRKKYKK